MATIYIVLTDTGSIVNRAIKTITAAPYNHASIALDEQLERIYSFARKYPTNPFWGGFVREDFVTGTFSLFPNSTCAIYRMELEEKNFQRLDRIIATFEKNPNRYFYNYIGLFGVPMNQGINIPSSYFCSQFVAEVLNRCGKKLFQKKSSLVTPDDFRTHPELTLVYEGILYDYPKLYLKNARTKEPLQRRRLIIGAIGTLGKEFRSYPSRYVFNRDKRTYFLNKIRKVSKVSSLKK